MENIESLFTTTSLLSLQGSVAAAVLVPNVVGNLIGERFDPFRKWAALGIALILAYVAAIVATDADPLKWVVAFFNGLLIFASAIGLNQLPRRNRSAPASDPPDGTPEDKPKAPAFFKSWV